MEQSFTELKANLEKELKKYKEKNVTFSEYFSSMKQINQWLKKKEQ